MSKPKDIDMARVQGALDLLGEHFDSVMIFANRHETGGTINVAMGCGNWFARYGHVKEWLIREAESTRISVRKKEEEDTKESG